MTNYILDAEKWQADSPSGIKHSFLQLLRVLAAEVFQMSHARNFPWLREDGSPKAPPDFALQFSSSLKGPPTLELAGRWLAASYNSITVQLSPSTWFRSQLFFISVVLESPPQ